MVAGQRTRDDGGEIDETPDFGHFGSIWFILVRDVEWRSMIVIDRVIVSFLTCSRGSSKGESEVWAQAQSC